MIYFIVPAYNEEKNIETLIAKTAEKMEELNEDYRILVVNDGSSDNTDRIVRSFTGKANVDILTHPTNLGVGAAFRNGFKKALAETTDDDIIVTKEADNTSDLSILKDMTLQIRGGSDVVLASCFTKGGGVKNSTPYRHMLSAGANALIKLFFNMRGLHTFSSFYRAYRPSILRTALACYGGRLIEEPGYECMVDSLIKLHRLTRNISEVPMVLRCDMREGKSKMKVLRTIRGYLRVVFKNLFLFHVGRTGSDHDDFRRAVKGEERTT
ncbi:MAG: glycosyltransferase [Candidatus Omnitrophica bacterium]|nr:glycosyltransferase [Candidatus Omnitrophota bacterium]